MKYLFKTLLVFFIVFSSSCTKDADDDYQADNDIIGVWEQDGFVDDSGYRLVFAADYTGIQIFRSVDDIGVPSSAISMHWKKVDGDKVEISFDSGTLEDYALSLNSQGQLISDNPDFLPFHKISDTTLDY